MKFTNDMTTEQFFYNEMEEFKGSRKRKEMINGEAYYDGYHDILKAKREAIGEDGNLEEVSNLPNNKRIDNQFARMVDQKVGYLLSKPISIRTRNKKYAELLKSYFDDEFMIKLQATGQHCILGGRTAWYVYYDQNSNLTFDVFRPEDCVPYWKDNMNTIQDTMMHFFDVEVWTGKSKTGQTKIEIFTMDGIKRYNLGEDSIIADMDNPVSPYIIMKDDDTGEDVKYNWEKFPIIMFKYNTRMIPLIRKTKGLQDGINKILSTFENNLEEDPRNCIIVLKNFDGQNLGEFRKNLSTYGVVKVRTVDGGDGAVETLTVEVSSENYQTILKLFKSALIENAHGYDAKDERMSGTPNEMNIRSMYSDLDLDMNSMEAQFKSSLKQYLWFVNKDLLMRQLGDFTKENVEFVFNRNIMMNTAEDINNVKNSVGILSTKTLLAHHPFVGDVEEELHELNEEKQKSMDNFGFGASKSGEEKNKNPDDGPDEGEKAREEGEEAPEGGEGSKGNDE